MVRNPTDLNQMALLGSDDAANVVVQSSLQSIGDQWRSVFCGEDNVIGQLCKCAHDAPFTPAVPRRMFFVDPGPHAEAWGYALCSFHERITNSQKRLTDYSASTPDLKRNKLPNGVVK